MALLCFRTHLFYLNSLSRPDCGRLCAPSPVGEGWDGGLNTLYNNLCMWLIYMSNVIYFINAPDLYVGLYLAHLVTRKKIN